MMYAEHIHPITVLHASRTPHASYTEFPWQDPDRTTEVQLHQNPLDQLPHGSLVPLPSPVKAGHKRPPGSRSHDFATLPLPAEVKSYAAPKNPRKPISHLVQALEARSTLQSLHEEHVKQDRLHRMVSHEPRQRCIVDDAVIDGEEHKEPEPMEQNTIKWYRL